MGAQKGASFKTKAVSGSNTSGVSEEGVIFEEQDCDANVAYRTPLGDLFPLNETGPRGSPAGRATAPISISSEPNADEQIAAPIQPDTPLSQISDAVTTPNQSPPTSEASQATSPDLERGGVDVSSSNTGMGGVVRVVRSNFMAGTFDLILMID